MPRKTPRADVVGSLLRPDYLYQAKLAMRKGEASREDLRALEDRAVLEAIALQESAGIDAISDGESRRPSWVAFLPLFDDPLYRAPISGFEFKATDAGWWSLWKDRAGQPVDMREELHLSAEPFITKRITANRDIVADEYGFLKANAHHLAKFNIPAPSWHRIFWHEEHSKDAYPTSDDFIADVARYMREEIVPRLLRLGCEYIQLDAPNYAQWHVDPDNRARFEEHGHDMAHELLADADFDNAVFEGLSGVTRAMHVCRGNAPDGRWLASGGYEAIASQVFPRLTNYDRLLLEYDSERAGGFAPLSNVLPQHTIVLGLVTSKDGTLEEDEAIEARIQEATQHVPLERLALSSQCGFASGERAQTMTHAQQRAKLELVGRVAEKVWGG